MSVMLICKFEGLLDDKALIEKQIMEDVAWAMEKEVAEEAKEEMSRQLAQYDFPYSRGAGGLSDRDNFHEAIDASPSEVTLTVTDDALFQGKQVDYTTLADVVEEGNEAFHMPRPRPFIDPTEQILEQGLADLALERGLAARGHATGA